MLMVAFNRRYLPTSLALKRLVDAGTPPPVPAEQSLTVVRIIDALFRSAETGRQIDLLRPGESVAAVA